MTTEPNTTTPTMTFASRQEYLKFRAEWKADYKNLSAEIRELKSNIRGGMRKGIYVGDEQNTLASNRITATDMMTKITEARSIAKALAKQRYAEKLKRLAAEQAA